MGRVIAFSEFAAYYEPLRERGGFKQGTIIDTNVLIALTYEVSANNEEALEFFESAIAPEQERGLRLFTTVNTRSEYLDFYRRLIMTENLRDMAEANSSWKLPAKARTQIQYQSGILKRREQQGGDPVFNDTQIKTIKSAFSAGRHSGHEGWLSLCDRVMGNRLDRVEAEIHDGGFEYISQHKLDQKNLFSREIDWPDAKRIAERTCLGLSDAMILNAFQCSHFPFIVSADFDIGYAVLASKELKDVVMPDSVAKKYRDYHFAEN
jgi:hypothetical protein